MHSSNREWISALRYSLCQSIYKSKILANSNAFSTLLFYRLRAIGKEERLWNNRNLKKPFFEYINFWKYEAHIRTKNYYTTTFVNGICLFRQLNCIWGSLEHPPPKISGTAKGMTMKFQSDFSTYKGAKSKNIWT